MSVGNGTDVGAQALPMALHLDLTGTYGALFVALMASAVLMGISNLQVYFFYTTYTRDTPAHKITVGLLWTLDMLHLALITHVVYYYLVQSFGNVAALVDMVWSMKAQITVNIFVVMAVQTLYVSRLIILDANEHRWLLWIMGFIMLGAYAVGILQIYEIFRVETFLEVETIIGWSTYMTLGCATAVDGIIATALVLMLARRRTGKKATDTVLTRLMLYVLNTGVLTSMCSIAIIVTYKVMPLNFVFLSLEFLVTKLYVNSYMAMLNARQHLKGKVHLGNGETSEPNDTGRIMEISVKTDVSVVPLPRMRSLSDMTSQSGHDVPLIPSHGPMYPHPYSPNGYPFPLSPSAQKGAFDLTHSPGSKHADVVSLPSLHSPAGKGRAFPRPLVRIPAPTYCEEPETHGEDVIAVEEGLSSYLTSPVSQNGESDWHFHSEWEKQGYARAL